MQNPTIKIILITMKNKARIQTLFKRKGKLENQTALAYSKIEVEDGAVVITDRFKLLYLKEDLESLGLLRKKNYLYDFEKGVRVKDTTLVYPEYESVMIFPEILIADYDFTWPLQRIETWMKQEKKQPEPYTDVDHVPVFQLTIEINEGKSYKTSTRPITMTFNAWLIYHAFKALRFMGLETVTLCITEDASKPLMLLLPNKGGFMLLCPYRLTGLSIHPKVFSQIMQGKKKRSKRLKTYRAVYDRGLEQAKAWLSNDFYKLEKKRLREYFNSL